MMRRRGSGCKRRSSGQRGRCHRLAHVGILGGCAGGCRAMKFYGEGCFRLNFSGQDGPARFTCEGGATAEEPVGARTGGGLRHERSRLL